MFLSFHLRYQSTGLQYRDWNGAIGAIIGVVVISILFVFPIQYLFDYNDDAAIGCSAFIFLAVAVTVFIIGEVLEGKGIRPRDGAIDFGLKWGLISLACISGLLILGCIIKALVNKFSE